MQPSLLTHAMPSSMACAPGHQRRVLQAVGAPEPLNPAIVKHGMPLTIMSGLMVCSWVVNGWFVNPLAAFWSDVRSTCMYDVISLYNHEPTVHHCRWYVDVSEPFPPFLIMFLRIEAHQQDCRGLAVSIQMTIIANYEELVVNNHDFGYVGC